MDVTKYKNGQATCYEDVPGYHVYTSIVAGIIFKEFTYKYKPEPGAGNIRLNINSYS